MNKKLFGLGLTAAALCVVPAFSQVHHGQAVGNGHTVGSAVYCSDDPDDFLADGGFARWTHDAHGHVLFTFGASEEDVDTEYVGLRIEGTGRANTFQADWNIQNSEDAAAGFFLLTPDGVSAWDSFGVSDGSISGRGFTVTDLSNGFSRIFYNPQEDGATSVDKWSNIYLVDVLDGEGGSNTIANVFVNGVAVVPNTHTGIQLDCSFDVRR